MIECTALDIPRFKFEDPTKTRKGRYSSCLFQIPNYGKEKWAFVCYIKPKKDLSVLKEETQKEEYEILLECIEYLNQIPSRQKYQKKEKKPLFGFLNKEPVQWSIRVSKEQKPECFIATLITDEDENKNIWGKGLNLLSFRKRKKQKQRNKK